MNYRSQLAQQEKGLHPMSGLSDCLPTTIHSLHCSLKLGVPDPSWSTTLDMRGMEIGEQPLPLQQQD